MFTTWQLVANIILRKLNYQNSREGKKADAPEKHTTTLICSCDILHFGVNIGYFNGRNFSILCLLFLERLFVKFVNLFLK